MPALFAFALVRRMIRSQRFEEGAKAAFARGPRSDVIEGEGMAQGEAVAAREAGGSIMRNRLLGAVVVFVALSVAARIVAMVISRKLTLGDESSDEFRAASIMTGKEFHSHAEHLRSGTAITSLGGMALDLTEATLDPAGASLELDTTMGGIEVIHAVTRMGGGQVTAKKM